MKVVRNILMRAFGRPRGILGRLGGAIMARTNRAGGRIALGFTSRSGQPKGGLIEVLSAAGFRDARVVETDGDFCALATRP